DFAAGPAHHAAVRANPERAVFTWKQTVDLEVRQAGGDPRDLGAADAQHSGVARPEPDRTIIRLRHRNWKRRSGHRIAGDTGDPLSGPVGNDPEAKAGHEHRAVVGSLSGRSSTPSR